PHGGRSLVLQRNGSARNHRSRVILDRSLQGRLANLGKSPGHSQPGRHHHGCDTHSLYLSGDSNYGGNRRLTPSDRRREYSIPKRAPRIAGCRTCMSSAILSAIGSSATQFAVITLLPITLL